MSTSELTRTHVALLALIVALAFALRVYGIGTLPRNYDEPYNAEIIDSIDLASLELPLHSFQHPPLSVYVLKPGTLLFGSNDFGYRIMNVLVGALSAALMFGLVRRGLGVEAGLLAALMLATNRFHIGWSRMINQEVLYLALLMVVLALFWRVYRRGTGWPPLLAAMVLALLAKELAVLVLAPLGLFLLSGERGRRLLRSRPALIGVVAVLVVATLMLLYAVLHPARDQANLSQNVYRLTSVGISVEPLEFFLTPSTTHDAALPDTWTYPYMFWGTGLLLVAGVLVSIRHRADDFVRLMLVLFGFYFAFFTLVGTDMSAVPLHQGEFWWVDVALIPGIALTAGMLIRLRRRSVVAGRLFWVVPVYLLLNAAFFAAVTKNGPILERLGLTYEEVATRVPFLF